MSQLKLWTPPVAPGEDDLPDDPTPSDDDLAPSDADEGETDVEETSDTHVGDPVLTDDESEAEVSDHFPRLADVCDLFAHSLHEI